MTGPRGPLESGYCNLLTKSAVLYVKFIHAMIIKLRRAYEKPGPEDGLRILVERLWPRGISKKDAKLDLWLKDVAPSNELRKWYGHDPAKWAEFKKRYFEELDREKAAVDELRNTVKGKDVTFVYSSKEEKYNSAAALREYLGR